MRFDITSALRDFGEDDIDVAVRFGAGRYPGLTTQRLFDNVIIPVCSPKLLKSGPPLNEPRDLLQHTLVHIEWSRQGVTWPNWRMWMAAAGIDEEANEAQVPSAESFIHIPPFRAALGNVGR